MTPSPEARPLHVLWLTSGLGCDGDSIAMTAATNPSLEDLLRGSLPGIPPIVLCNPVLAFESGEEFMRTWEEAAAGRLDPFVLVLEGSVPNEDVNGDGHWAGMGVDAATGQPILTNEWIDRLTPRAAAVLALGTCAAYGGVPAMRNNPTGAMGLRDYLGWKWQSQLGIPVVNLPGCPVQPDNITQTLLRLALQLAGLAPPIDLDDQGRPVEFFDRTVHERCDRAGFADQAQFSEQLGDGRCLVKLGCSRAGRAVQRPNARVGERRRRVPERRRHLHGVHDAGVPRPIHALHGAGRRRQAVRAHRPVRRTARSCATCATGG